MEIVKFVLGVDGEIELNKERRMTENTSNRRTSQGTI